MASLFTACGLDGAAFTLDQTERAEGNIAIDSAKTETEARGLLEAIRVRYRPAWVALAGALSAALAYAEGSGSLEALSAAYCTLRGVAPKLKLPALMPCGETP
jgi:hypothetical protein